MKTLSVNTRAVVLFVALCPPNCQRNTSLMKTPLCLMLAAGLSACSNMETHSGPYVNKPAIQQGVDTMQRAGAYESRGAAPGDAWERSRMDNGFSGPFGMMGGGMTPLAGYGWSAGTGSRR
jgi:hypothetical protein